jgi:iron(III) transport system ATP-binding protein
MNGHACADGPCRLLLRPEQLVLHPDEHAGGAAAEIVEVQYQGHDALARLRLSDNGRETLLARVPGDIVLAPGQRVWVEVVGFGRAWAEPVR